jgi:hypothetical protein
MLTVIISCSDDCDNFSQNQKLNEYQVNEHNQALEILSIAYAKALENKEIRDVLKTEALKKFDGDYDVLHRTMKSKMIEGLSLNRILAKNISAPGYLKSAETGNDDIVDSLASNINNLQVSVPVHCDEWDVDTFTPQVIFLPSNFEESSFDKLKAYNADGSYDWVSTVEEPDLPYVVLSPSERIVGPEDLAYFYDDGSENHTNTSTSEDDIDDLDVPDVNLITYGSPLVHQVTWTPTENETGYEIYRSTGGEFSMIGTTSYNDCAFTDDLPKDRGVEYDYKVRAVNNEGHSDWGKTMSRIASERTDNRRLRVTKIFMSKGRLKNVEAWVSGAPEIRLYIATGSGSTIKELSVNNWYKSPQFEPNKRKSIQDKWWNMHGGGITTDPWSLDDDINPRILNFVWVEEDWEDMMDIENLAIEWTVPKLEIKLATSIKLGGSRGKEIGTFQVTWSDKLSREYVDGGFKFNLFMGGE